MNTAPRIEIPFNPGKSSCKIAFVFACPGRKELNDKKIASGATGKNLSRLIEILHQYQPELFRYLCRYDYCITNASSKVYYNGYFNSRTLPYLRTDVYKLENIARLKKEMCNKKVIIAFGKTANRALIKANIPHIESKFHLGYQGINHISKDCDGNTIFKGTKNATELRMKVIAMDLLEKLKQ